MNAGESLSGAIVAALAAVRGLSGCYEGPPLQAVFPYATVEAGFESDWSHKSGTGREVRLTVTLRDQGERPARLRALMAEAEAAVAAAGGEAGGWRIVTLSFLRSRLLPQAERQWTAVLDYRARMLSE